MQKSPSPYIHHIINAVALIRDFLEDIDKSEFKKNNLVQAATIRQLEIIGEACNNLEEKFKQSRPNIPWQLIIGMRNKLAHDYWDIDIDLVWKTAKKDAPVLQKQLLDLLSEIGK